MDPLFSQLVAGAPQGNSIASYLVVPPDIQLVLDANAQLNPGGELPDRFVMAIVSAVQASLRDTRTSPRLLTEQAIKERVDLCLDVFRVAYHDMKMSMIQLIDMMEQLLFHSLIEKGRADDRAELASIRKAWRAPTLEPQATIGAVDAVAMPGGRDTTPAEGIEDIEVGEPAVDFSVPESELPKG